MDRYEQSALYDFVATIIWPTRTVRLVTTGGGEQEFNVNAPAGGWATATDVPMAWVNGRRVTGTITWVSGTRVSLPETVAVGSQVIIYVHPGGGSGYLPRTGLAAMLGALDMANFQVKNLGASTQAHHAVRRDEVLAIVSQLVGGNYVLKAGDQMTGDLLLQAAGSILDDASAVRRDMVALLDASQDFTGKIKGVTTEDGDPDTTLTTKDWVSGKVAADLANLRFPSRSWVRTTPGAYTLAIPAGVTQIFAHMRGGDGGGGGRSGSPGYGNGGAGGAGGRGFVVIPISAAGETISIDVAGGGQGGGAPSTGDARTGGGGGGGGGSRITAQAGVVVAGGGGGGGGAGDDYNPSPAGGSGGSAGQPGNASYAAAAGNSITEGGGAGGGRSAVGSAGSLHNPESFDTAPSFIASSSTIYEQVQPSPGSGGIYPGGTSSAGRDGIVEIYY